MQSSDPRHFFETDAAQETRARRVAKSANQYGHPVVLKSKILAVLADPASPSHVFVAESAGTARRVHVDGTGPAGTVFRGPTAPVTSLALGDGSNGRRILYAGSWDRSVWAFDAATGQVVRQLVGHTDFVKAVVCGRLGGQSVVISGGADKKIIVWDAASGRRLHTLADNTGGPAMLAVQALAVDRVATTADELWLVSASSDPHIRRWRIRTDGWEQVEEAAGAEAAEAAAKPPRRTLLAHETTVYKLVFEDYNYVGGDDDGDEEVDLWTCSADGTAKCLSRLRGFSSSHTTTTSGTLVHGDHVRAVAVTDAWVITAGRDENLQFWDRASSSESTARKYAAVEGHYDEVTDLAVLADRRRLCSVSLDGTVRTWPLDKAGLDALVQEQEKARQPDAADAAAAAAPIAPESGLTAEEEAELAELMDD